MSVARGASSIARPKYRFVVHAGEGGGDNAQAGRGASCGGADWRMREMGGQSQGQDQGLPRCNAAHIVAFLPANEQRRSGEAGRKIDPGRQSFPQTPVSLLAS